MKRIRIATPHLLVGGLLALFGGPTQAQVAADQVVATMEALFGVTPGERRNHTKGTCAAGEFVGRSEAKQVTRSALFSGAPIPVVARFSMPGGNPKVPDTARSPRGLALEFRLPDGKLHHMTMLSVPVFGAASPQTFLDDLQSRLPDPATGKPDPQRIAAFRASHPDTKPLAEFLAKNNPPAGYATVGYFGIHTFRFVDSADRATLVRFRFVPQDGEKRLTDDELKTLPANFLEAGLIERVRSAPARWDLLLSIGQPGDVEDDPTVQWPGDRRELAVGTLSIASAAAQPGAACEKVNFDPLVMADGIEPTKDPVLLFRSPAYAQSFGRRLGGK